MELRINDLISPVIDETPKMSIVYPDGEYSSQKTLDVAVNDGKTTVLQKSFYGDARVRLPLAFEMEPMKKYHVEATSVTENGKTYTAKTTFSTGNLGGDWIGRWITASDVRRPNETLAAVYLRRDFSAKSAPRRAMLYISGLGYFEAHINGEKVGDDYLSTAYTSYDKHILYRAFDVTEMINAGDNAIGVILGNGFYNCFTIDPWQTATAPWRDVPKLLCELHIEYDDGEEIVKSDTSWQCVRGPITFNGIRHGEEYDARLEKDGWDKPGYAGESFPSRRVKAPGAIMKVMEMEPIRVREKFHPVARRKGKNGWIYELAQDTAGVCRVTFSGKAGTTITVRYCDLKTEDGELDQEAINSFVKNYTFQTDKYTKKSDEKETWNAIFTYHGIQYIEISGCDTPPECSDVEVLAFCNDLRTKSEFSSSDADVNFMQHMCLCSTTACLMNTLSSDTVREKTSWTGDAGLTTEQLLINFDAVQLMKKWQIDLRDSMRTAGGLPCVVPSTGWGFNSINGPDWSHPVYEVPWQLYMATGDEDFLSENIETLRLHCDYVYSMAEDDGTVHYGLGDWCAPFEGAAISVNMEKFKCPVEVSDTAFYYSALTHLCKFAEILGRDDIVKKYGPRAEATKKVFREKFFDKKTYTVKGDCQSATGIMVYHGLCESDETAPLGERLCEQIERDGGHLDFGVLGAKAVLDTLGRTGHADVALKILLSPEYPSVKHWMDMGATTMWECWNGLGSHNQQMFTAISAFLYKYIAGVYVSSPAGREVTFCPGLASGLDHAEGYIRTGYGKAECKWHKDGDGFEISVTVPSSCCGTLKAGGKEITLTAGEHTIKI